MAEQKSPLLLAVQFAGERKSDSFSEAFTDRDVINLNDGTHHPEIFHGVKYAIVWKPDAKLLARLPDLEIIFSAGAGVDSNSAFAQLDDLETAVIASECEAESLEEMAGEDDVTGSLEDKYGSSNASVDDEVAKLMAAAKAD